MSFATFLGRLLKIGFGYIGGFVLLMAGMMFWIQQNTMLGVPITLFGFVLIAFGVYNEKQP